MTTAAPEPAAATTLDILRDIFDGLEPRNFDVRLWDGTTWRPDGGGESAFTIVVERPSALRSLLHADSEAALVETYLAGDLSIEGDIYAVPAVGRAILEHHIGLGRRARIALRLLRLPKDGDADGAGEASDDGVGPDSNGAAAAVTDSADAAAAGGDGAETDASPGEWAIEAVQEAGAATGATERTGQLPEAELHGAVHSIERDRAAVTHHYDLSNRFYSMFLDPRMVYSCAVFRRPDESLETAQLRKLDLICRKLRIREGDRLLDIGCGWGALIIHAAREYGAEALGITLSERQAELARARIREAGLEGRCRVEVRDYRRLDDDSFDRIASVGMFEHVGRERAPEYFATIHRLLRHGGSYLHHAITANPTIEGHGGPTLSDKYVFPDHELIPVGETVTFAEETGFDVRDVENLREHYALTLRRWVAALESQHTEAAAEVGEATWRAWHLMFAGSAVDFESGRTGLAQILMVRPRGDGSAGIPLGRWDWYRDGEEIPAE